MRPGEESLSQHDTDDYHKRGWGKSQQGNGRCRFGYNDALQALRVVETNRDEDNGRCRQQHPHKVNLNTLWRGIEVRRKLRKNDD